MTTKRPQLWQRHGFQNKEAYDAAKAATRRTKKAALLATQSKLSTRAVLDRMWQRADWHRPYVTLTKEQLMADLGLSLKTVQRAWQELREEGSIKPARNWQGGRSIPTEWYLAVAGQRSTPMDDHIEAQERKRNREAAWKFLRGKYGGIKALELMGDPEEQEY